MNQDEIENNPNAETNTIETKTPATRIETVRTEIYEVNAETDLRLRYIVPIVISLFLLIILLTQYSETPEIIRDFANSLDSKPAFFVKSPEQENRFSEIIDNIPFDVQDFRLIEVPGFNLIGSIAQRVKIEDRVNAVVYSLVYVNIEDKTKRVVIHFLDRDKEAVSEFDQYSAKRMEKSYRIYRVDEILITLLRIDRQDIVVVQEGTDLNDAETFCRQIFPELTKS